MGNVARLQTAYGLLQRKIAYKKDTGDYFFSVRDLAILLGGVALLSMPGLAAPLTGSAALGVGATLRCAKRAVRAQVARIDALLLTQTLLANLLLTDLSLAQLLGADLLGSHLRLLGVPL